MSWILHNDQKSYRVPKAILEELLSEADKGVWHFNLVQGRLFGEKLYGVLNGDGLIEDLRKKQRDLGEVVTFILELPGHFNHVPFETIWNETALFTLDETCHLVRQVTSRNRYRDVKLEHRPISMLFMAGSPIDSKPVLAFEAEEEAITKQIEEHKLPIDIYVEDSGSLKGLRTTLKELKGVDILHLPGHAKLGPDGPISQMESDTGYKVDVMPSQLGELYTPIQRAARTISADC